MTRTCLLILVSGFLVMTSVETYGKAEGPSTDAGHATHPFGPLVTAFSLDTLKSLSRIDSTTENILFSPSSLYKTLLAVYLGGSGVGKANLAQALHLQNVQFDVASGFENWRKFNNSIVREGERLFYDQDNHIEEDFKSLLRDDIKGLRPTDHKSKKMINNWASQTMGYKDKIIKGKQLYSMKLLPISLASSKYNLKNTLNYIIPTRMDFSLSADKGESVDSMERQDTYKYYEDLSLKTKILSIQYETTQWSFIMLLPDEGQSVTQLIASLTVEKFENILRKLKDTKVVLQMPQIRTEQVHNITKICETLKICDLMKKDNTYLQGITSDSGFYITDFIHKVGFQLFAEVDGGVAQPWYTNKLFFSVTRPFVYMVYDNQANMPIVLGTMMNPKQ